MLLLVVSSTAVKRVKRAMLLAGRFMCLPCVPSGLPTSNCFACEEIRSDLSACASMQVAEKLDALDEQRTAN